MDFIYRPVYNSFMHGLLWDESYRTIMSWVRMFGAERGQLGGAMLWQGGGRERYLIGQPYTLLR